MPARPPPPGPARAGRARASRGCVERPAGGLVSGRRARASRGPAARVEGKAISGLALPRKAPRLRNRVGAGMIAGGLPPAAVTAAAGEGTPVRGVGWRS